MSDKHKALAIEDDGERSESSTETLTQAGYDSGHGEYFEACESRGKPQLRDIFLFFLNRHAQVTQWK